eukprot:COSAG06_NODE_440_length_15762_cov_75.979825_3_plen_341_part_00
MVGAHLKKAAKDKAVEMAQTHLGQGLADQLGMAAKSVAKKSAAHALDQASDVHDAASAKAAARSVGDVAKKEGISQLSNLADKYFSGAGTPAQAVRVCAYNVTTLRKIVTKYRRELSAMSPTEFLRIHAKIGLKTNTIRLKSKRSMNERLALFLEYTSKTARSGGYSAVEKKRLVKTLKKRFHGTPPSKMSRDQLIGYIYSVARDLDVDWTPFFESFAESKRIRKGCRRKAGPGQTEYDATPGKKRPASAYNKFVKEMMLTYDFDGGTTQKEKMKIIGKLWAEEKTSILDEEHYAAVDKEDRAAALARKQKQGLAYKKLKKKKKIPKKSDDADLELDFLE